jgi:endogenous inhibitor of DNA gyrase (YacG/DUF329 family)
MQDTVVRNVGKKEFKVCPICKGAVKSRFKNQKYCSRKCARIAIKQKQKEYRKNEKNNN